MFTILVGLSVSCLYSRMILPKNHGEQPCINPTIYPFMYKGMLIVPYNGEKAIHVHHWIIYFILCLMSLVYQIPHILVGFSFGLCIQGIQYKDRCDFICDNPYNSV